MESGQRSGVRVTHSIRVAFIESHPGDVIYTSLFGRPVIVLNSIEAARDLLDNKGSIYSDRPLAVVFNEMWVRSGWPLCDLTEFFKLELDGTR